MASYKEMQDNLNLWYKTHLKCLNEISDLSAVRDLEWKSV